MATPASTPTHRGFKPHFPTPTGNSRISNRGRDRSVALAGGADRSEAEVAWRLFRFNWLLLLNCAAAVVLALMWTDFRVQPSGYLTVLAVAAACGLLGYRNAVSKRYGKPWIFSPLTAAAQMMLVIPVMISATYIATSANLPLQDANLLALDRAIGFDFRGVLNFVNDRVWLISILAAGYCSISWPICVIVAALPLASHYRRTAEFVCAFLLALIATTLITALVPAIGVYGEMGLVAADFPNIVPQGYYDTLRDAPLLRDGSLRTLDLWHLAGVVTFPSFHAAAAVLYAWAMWPMRLLRLPNLLCNGAMLAATPIGGGHYLVDVIAGVAVAAASIWIAGRMASKLAKAERAALARRPVGSP
jgi:membrane-associated phospholipid phosphatase